MVVPDSEEDVSLTKALMIQFVGLLACWLFALFLIFASLVGGDQEIWQTINGVSAIFITAAIYSRMITYPGAGRIGFRKALVLSAIITLIGIILKIPIGMLRA